MGDYEMAWQDYKKRRNQFLFLLIGWFPMMAACGYVIRALFHGYRPATVFVILNIAWIVLLIISGSRLTEWRCPCCEQPFFTTWLWCFNDPFVRVCVHCRLPKYASSDRAQ